MLTELTKCRICKNEDLEVVLDLGEIYPSGFLKPDEKLSEDMKAPLVLCRCKGCGVVQLKHSREPDSMYRQYWYTSSLNKSMVSSLQDLVNDIETRVNIEDNDIVVDIGCNDGTMLSLYSNKTIKRVGYDPSKNLEEQAKRQCTWFVNDYFSAEAYPYALNVVGQKAKVITAIAMFYDLEDPIKFCKDVVSILDEKGIFVIQFTDLASMIRETAFDNICHEHLEYYRLEDIANIYAEVGLRIIDVSYNDVNGGSIRVTATHRDNDLFTPDYVIQTLVDEFNYLKGHPLSVFKQQVETIQFKVNEFLKWAKDHGHVVYLMGASTKGNTLLQLCGVNHDLVPYAAEVNKEKFGLRTAGTDIEIISEEEALIKHPTHFLVPVWHFKQNLLSNPRIQDYLKSGGYLVFPLPYFHIVTDKGEWKI